MTAPHTGTTIVAVSFNGGVVIGADSRVSMGAYINNRASNKTTPLTENVWLLRSGSAADAQAISDYVRHWSHQHSIQSEREPSVQSIANLCKLVNYNNKQLVGALLVAGWDSRKGGQIYCVPIGGSVVQEPWGADGSGSPFLLGYLDSTFREGMSQAETEQIVETALSLAMTRDGSSGGMIRLVTIDKDGPRHRIIQGDKVQQSWDEQLGLPTVVTSS